MIGDGELTRQATDLGVAARATPSFEPTPRVVAVVLAAGSARRFAATKQVADLDGRPLVAHVVAAAHAAGVHEVVVVVGHDAGAVAAAAAEGGSVRIVDNPRHTEGQSTSLAAGLAAADEAGAEVAVVLLADEPDVRSEAVAAVAEAVAAGAVAARTHYDDGPGHPVAFSRAAWSQLAGLRGDQGARDVLDDLGVVAVPVAGTRPVDLDTRAALAARRTGTPSAAHPEG